MPACSIIRIQPEYLVQFLFRLCVLAEPGQDDAEIEVGIYHLRVRGESATEVALGLSQAVAAVGE